MPEHNEYAEVQARKRAGIVDPAPDFGRLEVCPECRSLDVRERDEIAAYDDTPDTRLSFECNACGHPWTRDALPVEVRPPVRESLTSAAILGYARNEADLAELGYSDCTYWRDKAEALGLIAKTVPATPDEDDTLLRLLRGTLTITEQKREIQRLNEECEALRRAAGIPEIPRKAAS